MPRASYALAVASASLFMSTSWSGTADEACRSIKEDARRLACYDAANAAVAGIDPSPVGAVAAATSWQIEDSKSRIDDSLQVLASASTKTDSDKPSALVIRCWDHKTEVYLIAQEFWGVPISGDPVPVLYRLAGSPPVKQQWHPGSGGSAQASSAFFPDAKRVQDFVSRLPNHGQIFFQVTDFRGASHAMTFSLDGIDRVRARVGAACKWAGGLSDSGLRD